MKSYLRDLYRYNQEANNHMITVLANSTDEPTLKLFSHILNAQAMWMSRVNSHLFTIRCMAGAYRTGASDYQ